MIPFLKPKAWGGKCFAESAMCELRNTSDSHDARPFLQPIFSVVISELVINCYFQDQKKIPSLNIGKWPAYRIAFILHSHPSLIYPFLCRLMAAMAERALDPGQVPVKVEHPLP